jgi:hypothetical protein
MITVDDYLMNRKSGLTFELLENAIDTVEKVNKLLDVFGSQRKVTSGYRPASVNAAIPNAAKKSNHMLCKACDLEDVDGKLDKWCMDNLHVLTEIGLWLEHPSATKTWCHIQTVPPKSGKRVFYP